MRTTNTSALKGVTEKNNSNVISNLSKALSQFKDISMPSNFQYSESLRSSIPNKIKKIEGKILEINTFINRKSKQAEKNENESINMANSLLKSISSFTDALGKTIFGTPAQNANANPSSSWLSKNMLNNPDYMYYLQTRAGNIAKNNKAIFPYSEAYMEKKYAKTMAEIRNKNLTLLANYTKNSLKTAASVGGIKAYASEILSNEKKFVVNSTIQLENEIKRLGGDSIQGVTNDGEKLVTSILMKKNKLDPNGKIILDSDGKPKKIDAGVIIAKYNDKTGKLEKFADLTELIGVKAAGHGQSIAYNNAANAYVIRNYAKEKSVFEIVDDESKEVTEYKLPDTYRVLTYDEKNNKLIGVKQEDKTITFLTRNESKKEYDNPEEVKLDYDKEFKNIQNISCDDNYIYLYQSGHKKKVEEKDWKTFVFDYDGKKVAEFKIDKGFNYPELEGGCKDKDNNHWIATNSEIAIVNKSDFPNTTMASN